MQYLNRQPSHRDAHHQPYRLADANEEIFEEEVAYEDYQVDYISDRISISIDYSSRVSPPIAEVVGEDRAFESESLEDDKLEDMDAANESFIYSVNMKRRKR